MKKKSTKRLPFFFGRSPVSSPVEKHPEAFLDRLKNQDTEAIQRLAEAVQAFLLSKNQNGLLSNEDVEEVVNDAVFITIQKIQGGQFILKDALPTTYAIAVAKKLVGNRLQKQKIQTTALEATIDFPSPELDPENYALLKEREELLGTFLNKLEEHCRQLILLRYYEKITDEGAIQQKLTPYSNAKSLKVQRCKCLKKLAGMLEEHKRFFLES